ncbi:hypothetical protein K7X08_036601 [Anisodus acutangulus]|uniref:Nascent polypeptide-associated complex subunit alpha-like UBA domain-containing protein n=1 Tax=Anisodus acutangulus TaxID=402998 RepID=A0A9Q1QWF2_9SOLA|nr:hypothetical protein K7X08_036601 [Anisodus acutangulus]
MLKIISCIPLVFKRLWLQFMHPREADLQVMRMREKKLAAVNINAADIDIIANELEVDKKVAERTLREHKETDLQNEASYQTQSVLYAMTRMNQGIICSEMARHHQKWQQEKQWAEDHNKSRKTEDEVYRTALAGSVRRGIIECSRRR